MFDTLRADFQHKAALFGLRPGLKSWLYLLFSEGSSAQILYRAMRYCQTHRLKVLALVLYRLNAALNRVVIGRNAEIGPGLVISHSLGIVINSDVKAGKNLVIEHLVTLGMEKKRSPVLGDNVFIGPGAKVIGGVCVGSDVKIGANAVVVKDVPDGATVVGIPARVVRIYGERVDPAHRAPSTVEQDA